MVCVWQPTLTKVTTWVEEPGKIRAWNTPGLATPAVPRSTTVCHPRLGDLMSSGSQLPMPTQ
jgi:hypothetical protein